MRNQKFVYLCNIKANQIKMKNIIERKLPLNITYTLTDKRYASLIELLTPLEAEKRGYLTTDDVRACNEWIAANFAKRHRDVIVYMNGVYCGVAKNNDKLANVIDRLRLLEPTAQRVSSV